MSEKTNRPEALRLADELARLAAGREEWRVQNPQNGSYCRSLGARESLSPERELRGWLEDRKRRFPDSRFPGYEVKKVRVTDAFDGAAQAAATELRHQHAHIAEVEGQQNELVDSVCSLENKVVGLEHLLRVAGVKNAELQAQLEAIGAGGVEPLRPFHAAPAFSGSSSSKLNELLERGYRISGYSFERTEVGSQVTRGFIDHGGLVGWWPPQAAESFPSSMPGKALAPQDSTGAATVDPSYHWRPVSADTPRGTKLQLIVEADGVAHHGQYQPGSEWTHWAPLPTFKTGE